MVTEITPDEVHEIVTSEEDAVIIDVLKRESYRKQHVPGAINVEMPDVEEVVPRLVDKDQKVVVYCYNTDCGASPKAAQALEDAGFTNVHDMEVGIEGYKEAGYDVITYS